jgi:hypothetical protein
MYPASRPLQPTEAPAPSHGLIAKVAWVSVLMGPIEGGAGQFRGGFGDEATLRYRASLERELKQALDAAGLKVVEEPSPEMLSISITSVLSFNPDWGGNEYMLSTLTHAEVDCLGRNVGPFAIHVPPYSDITMTKVDSEAKLVAQQLVNSILGSKEFSRAASQLGPIPRRT